MIRAYDPFVAHIWAFGECLYALLLKKYPFLTSNDPKVLQNVCMDQMNNNYNIPNDRINTIYKHCKHLLNEILNAL